MSKKRPEHITLLGWGQTSKIEPVHCSTSQMCPLPETLTWHCWYLNHGFQTTACTDRTAYPKPWLSCHIPNKTKKITAVVQMVTFTPHVPSFIQRLWTSLLRGDLTSEAAPELAVLVPPSLEQLQLGAEYAMRAGASVLLSSRVVQPGLALHGQSQTNPHSQPCAACVCSPTVPQSCRTDSLPYELTCPI